LMLLQSPRLICTSAQGCCICVFISKILFRIYHCRSLTDQVLAGCEIIVFWFVNYSRLNMTCGPVYRPVYNRPSLQAYSGKGATPRRNSDSGSFAHDVI
jgi:hypothetical protein